VVTAAVGAPILLLVLYLGDWVYGLAIGLLAVTAGIEALRLVGLGTRRGFVYGGALALALWQWAVAFRSGDPAFALAVVNLSLLGLVVHQVLTHPRTPTRDTALAWLALAYVAVTFGHFPALRALPQGLRFTVTTFVYVWVFDTTAYLVGIRWGRRRLAPRLSPGKSVEGAVAGSLAVLAVALIPGALFPSFLALRLGIGAAVIIFGQIGDLFESSLKRFAEVKDSSRLLPGHGGILDRFDSLMLAVPAVYYLLRLWLGTVGL